MTETREEEAHKTSHKRKAASVADDENGEPEQMNQTTPSAKRQKLASGQSDHNENKAQALYRQNGFAVFPAVLENKEADTVAQSVLDEALQIALHGEDLKALQSKVSQLSLLLNDQALRDKHCENAKCVWDQGNTRKPHVGKNNGMCNIYHNRLVRELVHFNPKAYEIISSLYDLQSGAETNGDTTKERQGTTCAESKESKTSESTSRPVFARGPDRVGIKAKGATDMTKHLDRNPFDMKEETRRIEENTKHRVQSFLCLRISSDLPPNRAGSIELLQGFHRVWNLAAHYFRTILCLKAGDETVLPLQLGPEFDRQLPKFLTWLKTTILNLSDHDNADDDAPRITRALQLDRDAFPSLPPLTVRDIDNIKWVSPKIRAGDLMCWDERLPHRNTRNDSKVERIVAYLSLFDLGPHDDINQETKTRIQAMFSGLSGTAPSSKAGHVSGKSAMSKSRDNFMEKRVFASTWNERTAFVHTTTSKTALGFG